jgi:4-amino-4-deoxy-L-arabinose transferase-like glycosyltransferase
MAYIILQSLFAIYVLAAFVIAIFYLRYRRCSPLEFALWGGLAFFLPVFGPFFVIAARPGPKKRSRRPHKSNG